MWTYRCGKVFSLKAAQVTTWCNIIGMFAYEYLPKFMRILLTERAPRYFVCRANNSLQLCKLNFTDGQRV